MDLRKYALVAAGGLLGLIISIPLELPLGPAAYAAPGPPNLSAGYYINTASTTTAYNLGCTDGAYDQSHGYTSRLAELDFGGQLSSGSGTELINGETLTNTQIEAVGENYGLGYFNCSGNTQNLTVAVGTNNSLSDISTTGGKGWHNVLHAIWTSSIAADILSQVNFIGGNDIEDWSSGTSASAVTAWANGWQSVTTGLYLNYGSADGCSETGYTSGNGYTCSAANSSFNQYNYWYLSYGLADAVVAPEIYASGQAPEWKEICLYGNYEHGRSIAFEGPLNDYYAPGGSSSYTPSQSWSSLWNALSGTACAQTPVFEIGQKTE